MTDFFQNTAGTALNLDLDENKTHQSPAKKVCFKTISPQDNTKENKKNNDSDISNSTNNNTFSHSGGNLSKISPLPKPDFSSITRFENSLSYKQKGSHKKMKLVPNSPAKTPNRYAFTPNDIKYSKDNILEKSACRKLNFFEGGDAKEGDIKEESDTYNNTTAFRSITEKKYLSRDFNAPLSFGQSTIPNLKTSDFLTKSENNVQSNKI